MAKILIIEDSEQQRAEIRAALETSDLVTQIVEADNGITGLKMIVSEADSIDLVLCDLEMPGLDGEKLLRMKVAGGTDTPFLVLTALTDPERRARLLEQGASDAITKPFYAADLVARVTLHLRLMQAQQKLIEQNRQLEWLSTTDPLTGLRNRRYLDERLMSEFARAQRQRAPLTVVMADIDHFKRINDEHGHQIGDAVLRGVGGLLHDSLRVSDCGGRYGGEEFLVILTSNDSEGALIFAERWRQNVEAFQTPAETGQSVGATISLGVAELRPDMRSHESLVAASDDALYQAKSSGRNQVVVAGSRR